MITTEKSCITVRAIINAPVKKVWDCWTDPKHIIHWNNASDDWHTPKAENNLFVGGRFRSRMEAKDGSNGFDFSGEYSKIEKYKRIEYILDDDRRVQISFTVKGDETFVTETFEAEQTNSLDRQKAGWQAILDNFRKYVEKLIKKEVLHFEMSIHAKAEKVYQTMLDEKDWQEWTSAFNPTSYYKGSWMKGSKILFLGNDKDGSIGGMASIIRENIPNKYISIEHLGIVRDGKVIKSGLKVDEWIGAMENYTFSENNGITLLSVEMDVMDEYKNYFLETWPKALQKLKTICEK
jgi:uncharacterized protein YndB with AHSA1/START domain